MVDRVHLLAGRQRDLCDLAFQHTDLGRGKRLAVASVVEPPVFDLRPVGHDRLAAAEEVALELLEPGDLALRDQLCGLRVGDEVRRRDGLNVRDVAAEVES
jgi:hypothetical protein